MQAEVCAFISEHAHLLDEEASQQLVRHGILPRGSVMTGIATGKPIFSPNCLPEIIQGLEFEDWIKQLSIATSPRPSPIFEYSSLWKDTKLLDQGSPNCHLIARHAPADEERSFSKDARLIHQVAIPSYTEMRWNKLHPVNYKATG